MKKKTIIRSLQSSILELAFANKKMAFVSGPRQCGKTTLAKMILEKEGGAYYNWDQTEFRRIWTKGPQSLVEDSSVGTVAFDEIHKAKGWKRTLKGLYDVSSGEKNLLITGSARLNVYKKGGDSLMGRYLNFRLHPFTLGELMNKEIPSPDKIPSLFLKKAVTTKSNNIEKYHDLFKFTGFPEPYTKKSRKWLELWRNGRNEKIIREDLRDLSRLPELSQIEMLCSLLPEKVGSLLSVKSLSEDLEVSPHSIKRWMTYLKELYYHFELRPFQKRISRTLKKGAKIYLYDWTEMKNPAYQFENMIACHMLKACHYWTDTGEGKYDLFYARDKEKHEIDFIIAKNAEPWLAFECKMKEKSISKGSSLLLKKLGCPFIQLIHEPNYHRALSKDIIVTSAHNVLQFLP